MTKKKKHRIQTPSLSALDKGIYYCLIAVAVVTGLFMYPAIFGRFRRSVFENVHLLAQSNLGIIPLSFFGMLIGVGFALVIDRLRRKKQPIFGKADVKYGSPRWKSVYPIFSKQFWNNLYSNKKNLVVGFLCVIAFAFVVVSATLLGLLPRECLYDDGSIAVYNCFNERIVKYDQSDVAEIRIYTRTYYERRGPDDWGIEMKLSMKDGEVFFFPYQDFHTRDDDIRGSITGMYQIKRCFNSSIITIDGKENVEYVVRDINLNRQEADLLRSLFDVDASLSEKRPIS